MTRRKGRLLPPGRSFGIGSSTVREAVRVGRRTSVVAGMAGSYCEAPVALSPPKGALIIGLSITIR